MVVGVCWTAIGVAQPSVGVCMRRATVLVCSNGDQVEKICEKNIILLKFIINEQ